MSTEEYHPGMFGRWALRVDPDGQLGVLLANKLRACVDGEQIAVAVPALALMLADVMRGAPVSMRVPATEDMLAAILHRVSQSLD